MRRGIRQVLVCRDRGVVPESAVDGPAFSGIAHVRDARGSAPSAIILVDPLLLTSAPICDALEWRYSPLILFLYRTLRRIILNTIHYIRISEETQGIRRSEQRKVTDKIDVLKKLSETGQTSVDCSMGRGGNTGVRSSQQAQQASTRLRILRCSGPLPEQSKLLAGISQTLMRNGGCPWRTESGIFR